MDLPDRRQFLRAGALAGLGGLCSMTSLSADSSGGGRTSSPAAGARREELYRLLGDVPDRRRPIGASKRKEEERDGYLLETLDLDLNGIERVPAYFARPRGLSGRAPAVLYNHSHGGGYQIGKKELADGRSYLQPVPYARELTALGYSVLCIDHWVFGERSHTSEMDAFKAMIWQGQVLWGMMVYDSLRAVDYLVTRPEVDPGRIATLGISMGSTMAWWLAALDERIKVTVDLCCLTEFKTLLAKKGLGGHGIYYYVPSLLKHFSTSQINALIAPRAHLALAGLRDSLTPPEGLDLIDADLKKVYTEAGHPERWKLLRYDVPHQETAEGRREVVKFLREFL
jgi:dienelactone hydrolase